MDKREAAERNEETIKYRLLKEGEIIEETDEYLHPETAEFIPVTITNGDVWGEDGYQPHRRQTKEKKECKIGIKDLFDKWQNELREWMI